MRAVQSCLPCDVAHPVQFLGHFRGSNGVLINLFFKFGGGLEVIWTLDSLLNLRASLHLAKIALDLNGRASVNVVFDISLLRGPGSGEASTSDLITLMAC